MAGVTLILHYKDSYVFFWNTEELMMPIEEGTNDPSSLLKKLQEMNIKILSTVKITSLTNWKEEKWDIYEVILYNISASCLLWDGKSGLPVSIDGKIQICLEKYLEAKKLIIY